MRVGAEILPGRYACHIRPVNGYTVVIRPRDEIGAGKNGGSSDFLLCRLGGATAFARCPPAGRVLLHVFLPPRGLGGDKSACAAGAPRPRGTGGGRPRLGAKAPPSSAVPTARARGRRAGPAPWPRGPSIRPAPSHARD